MALNDATRRRDSRVFLGLGEEVRFEFPARRSFADKFHEECTGYAIVARYRTLSLSLSKYDFTTKAYLAVNRFRQGISGILVQLTTDVSSGRRRFVSILSAKISSPLLFTEDRDKALRGEEGGDGGGGSGETCFSIAPPGTCETVLFSRGSRDFPRRP